MTTAASTRETPVRGATARCAAAGRLTAPVRRPSRIPAAVFVASLANAIVMVDATIVTVALPSIQDALHLGAAGLPWVVNGYSLTFGCLLLLAGLAVDRLGPRRLFVAGTVLFALGSMLAALADSGPHLLAGRVVQGIGGAVCCPAALTMLTTAAPAGAPRNRALAIWAAAGAAAIAIGPVLGGVLTAAFGWASVFWLPALLCLGTAAAAARVTPRTPRHAAQPSAATHPAAPLEAAAFPLGRVVAACAALALGSAALVGADYAATLWVQRVLRLAPLWAGIALLPLSAGIVAGAMLAPALSRRIGERRVAVAGLLATAVAMMALVPLPARTALPPLMAVLLLIAVGFGVQSVPVSARATSVPRRHGVAAAAYQTCGQLGGGLGLLALASAATAAGSGAAGDGRLVAGFHVIFLLGALALGVASLVVAGWGGGERPGSAQEGDSVHVDLAGGDAAPLVEQQLDAHDDLLAGGQRDGDR